MWHMTGPRMSWLFRLFETAFRNSHHRWQCQFEDHESYWVTRDNAPRYAPVLTVPRDLVNSTWGNLCSPVPSTPLAKIISGIINSPFVCCIRPFCSGNHVDKPRYSKISITTVIRKKNIYILNKSDSSDHILHLPSPQTPYLKQERELPRLTWWEVV